MDILELHKFFIIIIDTILIFLLIMVVLNSHKKRDSWLFALTSFSMFTWVNFAYLARVIEVTSLSVLFLKIAWFVTPVFFLVLYFFSLSLLHADKRFKNLTIINIFFTSIASIASIGTNLIIEGREFINGSLVIEYGRFMYSFLFIVVLLILSVWYVFKNRYKQLNSEDRKKATPFIIGLIFFYVLNFIFNILLPMFFNITQYYYLGDYSTIVLTTLIVYSMFKDRFLGIKLIMSTVVISVIGMFLLVEIAITNATFQERAIKLIIFIFYLILSAILQKSILTEQRQEEELKKLNAQLDKKTHTQQDMMDVLAHEVKTPVSKVLFESEILENKVDKLLKKLKIRKNSKEAKEITEVVDYIENSSHQGISIIDGLLEFTRLQNNKFQLNYSTFDLVKLINRSINSFKNMSKGKDIEINNIAKLKELYVYADSTRIQEALEGLLINAEKYGITPGTNKISITVNVQRDTKKNEIQIIVADNGIGLTQEDKENLGKKFYRANFKSDDRNKEIPTGTGLGLFMINLIMSVHKGKLTFDSEGINKGSSFILHIPLRKKE